MAVGVADQHNPGGIGSSAVPENWTPLQFIVIFICVLINMVDGMDVLIISYVAPAMAAEWAVSFEALGFVFSAGLAGMMLGCVAIAPIADSIGRRPVVLAALLLIAVGGIGTGLVGSLYPFIGFRFITGIGIGTLLASVAALASEYAPERQRSIAIGAFQAGYPIGAVATGFVAIWAIPTFGWQPTLLATGILSAAILPIAFFLLPESIDFLQNRQPKGALEKVNGLRRRLGLEELAMLPPPVVGGGGPKLSRLFADGLWRSTLTLWVATFAGFAVLYFVTSWIPKLAIEAGLSASNSLWAGSVFNLGGVIGTLTIGYLATRLDVRKLICVYMVLGAILLVGFSVSMPLALVLMVVVALGLSLQGGFSGFYSLAAQLYPSDVRSSGIGWAIGIGRGGAVIGPLMGGYLLEQSLPLWVVFFCFAVPMALSGVLAALVRFRT